MTMDATKKLEILDWVMHLTDETVFNKLLAIKNDARNKDEVVAIPTETVYGLAANIYSEKAVKNIFKEMGTFFPNSDKMPKAKAMSVAMGIPAPDWVSVP